ncbi:dolichyl-phosphate beta-glucosyltransferase [Tieghemiomyces parasiticus]|uniref:dolichyl-phosphate beta-glucosyltransferase n=1 Tax=Tieghemiomyces parasiticus TaxID=78921 RepID=A0A9W7ZW70_9FUNG|nr:dolichyl-phosphate beta-glucosyltransferase [Tieghemiomyces parasiticus]
MPFLYLFNSMDLAADLSFEFMSTILAGLVIGGVTALYTFLTIFSPKRHPLTDEERYYYAIDSAKRQPLDSVLDPPRCTLSVVVPAYNESQRLPTMLADAYAYLEARTQGLGKETGGSSDVEHSAESSTVGSPACTPTEDTGFPRSPVWPRCSFSYEIIVVDDGSRDNTAQVALEFARNHQLTNLRVIKFKQNRGKGGAVTEGFLHARGEYILFADADGATDFQDIQQLFCQLKSAERDGLGVAVGSRAHLKKAGSNVQRSLIRTILMRAFHTFVYIFGIRNVDDTQCGFKLFTRRAAQAIFTHLHVERWIFDIEVLMLAGYFDIPVVEVPVSWHEIAGSKMSLVLDSIQMATDLLLIRSNYVLGIWQVRPLPPPSPMLRPAAKDNRPVKRPAAMVTM